ncbi:replication initiation regulator SeqA [Celerinatantimonas sp. YJH-8]|uniref:replication initiation regulator SeqA n=1 Tax=Celerinatantimonas sp. YJH-8 TaxID=3228714 RepID=UPI0038C5EB3B
MKSIEIDDELYHYIASQTQYIGESASEILRRLLKFEQSELVASSDENRSSAVVEQILTSQEFMRQSRAVKRFMVLLSHLYQHSPDAFTQASRIKGSKRVYFATSRDALLASGKTTKPQAIPNTPFWVITNTNTGRKRLIISQLMETMGYSQHDISLVSEAI